MEQFGDVPHDVLQRLRVSVQKGGRQADESWRPSAGSRLLFDQDSGLKQKQGQSHRCDIPALIPTFRQQVDQTEAQGT